MISDFAKEGKIHIDGQELPIFSSTTSSYLQLTSNPKIDSNFRFCEMALWAGLVQRLQNPLCHMMSVVKKVPGDVIKATKLDGVAGNLGVKGAGVLKKNPLMRSGGKSPLGFL